jgi:hypothetical protein
MLDRVARRYNRRPSEILGISDNWLAIDFDFACAYRGNKEDEKDFQNASRQAGQKESTDEEFWKTVNKVRRVKGLPPIKKTPNG